MSRGGAIPRMKPPPLEAHMESVDMVIVALILAAFGLFAGVLGWAAHVDYKRPERDQLAAGE